MRRHHLGDTGVTLSSIGLGGFELGPERGADPDLDRAVALMRAAHDAEMNWIDTSENYHETRNEALIGQALAHVPPEFLIATKVAPGAGLSRSASGFRPEQVHAACRASLRRLHREHIDVYFLHWPDRSGVPLEETWGAMTELVTQGLVRTIGLSNYELAQIEKCHAQRPVDVIQTGLSLLHCLEDRPLIRSCGERGIGVTIYEPLAGGILTDKSIDQLRERWSAYQESGFYQQLLAGENGQRSAAVSEALRSLAERKNLTVAQLAVAWVLHQPGVLATLVGTQDPRRVQENARATETEINDIASDIEAIIPLGPGYVPA